MELRDLSQLLENAAAGDPNRGVIAYAASEPVTPRRLSYAELLELARSNSKRLRKLEDVPEGSVILLHFEDHLDNIVWFWSTIYARCIPAMSTALPRIAEQCEKHLNHLKGLLDDPVCLTRSNLLKQFLGQNILRTVDVDHLPHWETSEYNNGTSCVERSDLALLMLTSGSTGNAKAVCLTHGQIITSVTGKTEMLPVEKDTSFLNWIRLDHVGSLIEIHLHALLLGLDQVHIQPEDVIFRPLLFLERISEHRVSRTFAPNFFLAELLRILQSEDEPSKFDLSRLQYIVSGGEANVVDMCLDLAILLLTYQCPIHIIVPGFGMTETCAGSIYNTSCPLDDKDEGYEFASLGRCIPGIQMRISQDGGLELAGPVVFSRYYNDEVATADAFTPDGWFKTGDTAFIDQSGRLCLFGRTKEVIAINGVKYPLRDIENAIEQDQIKGITPNHVVCLSTRQSGAHTEQPWIGYLPSFDPDDAKSLWDVYNAVGRQVLLMTATLPTVVPLTQLQLERTSLGKLSRSKIRTARENGQFTAQEAKLDEIVQRYQKMLWVAPETVTEEAILEELESILDVPAKAIGVETPMFEVGLTSVALLKLKRRIEERLGINEIPLVTMMKHPSVRSLASALQSPDMLQRYDPVVTLHHRGEKTPLWLVHPGVGEILVFLGLSKFIQDRPVHALRARGFNPGEAFFDNISECVDIYVSAVQEKQPHGPYALAGYSYGSMLAFEIAKVLIESGEEVRFLGCLNLPPHIKHRMRQLDWSNCLLHLSFFLDIISEKYSEEISPAVHDLPSSEAVAYIMSVASPSRVAELALTAETLEHWANLACGLQSMACEYEPTGTVTGMDIFYCDPLAAVARNKTEWLNGPMSDWNDFCQTPVEYHDVQGAHYTMLAPEHVRSFHATFQKALVERGL